MGKEEEFFYPRCSGISYYGAQPSFVHGHFNYWLRSVLFYLISLPKAQILLWIHFSKLFTHLKSNYYSDYYSDYRFLSNPPAFVLQYEETQEDNKFSAMVMGVWGMWWAAQGTFWTCRHCMKGGFLTDSALAKTEVFCTAWALFSEIAKLRKSSEA